jgi:hypothetical protein
MYTLEEIRTFRDVFNHFEDVGADEANWLFLSTGGYHGSKQTLEDMERILRGEDETWLPNGAHLTVLIVCPEATSMKWGTIHIKNKNEIEYLRKRVKETMEIIPKTQEGNQ